MNTRTYTSNVRLDSEWQKDNIHARERLTTILSEYSRGAFTVDSFSDRELHIHMFVYFMHSRVCESRQWTEPHLILEAINVADSAWKAASNFGRFFASPFLARSSSIIALVTFNRSEWTEWWTGGRTSMRLYKGDPEEVSVISKTSCFHANSKPICFSKNSSDCHFIHPKS